MFAILAEHDSDAEVLSHIVERHLSKYNPTVKKKGYGGCGRLCANGARDIRTWSDQGIKRFVICHDADDQPPDQVREKVFQRVVKAANAEIGCCIAVPVREIEAWLIADESAIRAVIPTFRFKGHNHPESIQRPKEWLRDQSETAKGRPLYVPTVFNSKVVKHLRLDVVAKKCPSFRAFLKCLDEQR